MFESPPLEATSLYQVSHPGGQMCFPNIM